MAATTSQWWCRLVNAYEVKAGMVSLQCKNCVIHFYIWTLRWSATQIYVPLPLARYSIVRYLPVCKVRRPSTSLNLFGSVKQERGVEKFRCYATYAWPGTLRGQAGLLKIVLQSRPATTAAAQGYFRASRGLSTTAELLVPKWCG